MAAQTSKRYSKSQEREERGATLSSPLSSQANPRTQKKVKLFYLWSTWMNTNSLSLWSWQSYLLIRLLKKKILSPVDAYISLEGEGFMEMRVKHLEKMGELAKAVVLAKACTECSFISNQATFRQTYVSLLCHLLPNEEAIMEVLLHLIYRRVEVFELDANVRYFKEQDKDKLIPFVFILPQKWQ